MEEKLDLETCVYKFKAMRTARLTEEEYKCRNCTKEIELTCDRYFPMSRTNNPVRRGFYAMFI